MEASNKNTNIEFTIDSIPVKRDNAEKNALIENIPIVERYTAQEFNCIVDTIKNLLPNYKIIAGNFLIDKIEVTNLVVGNTYFILEADFDSRDDFFNVGFVSYGKPFVAVAAIPDAWNDTVVYRLNFQPKIFQDTLVDVYAIIYNPTKNSVYFKILNKLENANNFVWSKTNAKQIDNSTIELFPFDNDYFNSFELRIYNKIK